MVKVRPAQKLRKMVKVGLGRESKIGGRSPHALRPRLRELPQGGTRPLTSMATTMRDVVARVVTARLLGGCVELYRTDGARRVWAGRARSAPKQNLGFTTVKVDGQNQSKMVKVDSLAELA